MNTNRKLTGPQYEFEMQFVPLPPEQKETWWEAMRILNQMIWQALAKQNREEPLIIPDVTCLNVESDFPPTSYHSEIYSKEI